MHIVALSLPVVAWAGALVAWRFTLLRLGLTSTKDEALGQRERTVVRALRALLAFNFLVVLPVAVLGMGMLVSGVTTLQAASLVILVGLMFFALPLPSLIATAKRLRAQRLPGVPVRDLPSFWLDDAMTFARERSSAAVWAVFGSVLLVIAGMGCTFASMRTGAVWLGAAGLALGISGLLLEAASCWRKW